MNFAFWTAVVAMWITAVLGLVLSPWFFCAAVAAFLVAVVLSRMDLAQRTFAEITAPPAPRVPGPYEHKGAYQPAAGRGNFWATVGTGTELAVDREARERADYELVKQKLAGTIARHPAGKARP